MTKGAFAALLRVRGVPRKPLPRQQPPDRIRVAYTKRLQAIMKWAQSRVVAELYPALKTLTENASRVATTDAQEVDAIGRIVDELRAEFLKRYPRSKLTSIVDPFAEATADFQAEQLNAQLREAVAVDVVGSESWLQASIDEFTAENVALIRTIPDRYFNEIETLVKREAADGARWETLVDGIEERYDVSRSRSKIIARDQVGKFYGDLNRVRQTDVGITRFVWRTMRDNRVRPEHEDLDGHSFEWSSAPEGGPGEPVLCRCYADPDLDSVNLDA
jgi:SPP1 gp7 family putative phage head morphogenesis protein